MSQLGPLEEAPAYMIYRLSRLLRQSLKQTLGANGIDVTSEQYFLLYRLLQKDGLTQSQLADKVLGDYPNITRHIDSLAKKGFVERKSDETDRRKYLISLTSEGREQMEKIIPVIQKERDRLFGHIASKDMDGFKQLIRVIQEKL